MIGEADKSRFFKDGYLVIPEVVPAKLCEAVVDHIAAWMSLDPAKAESWPSSPGHGIVPVHHAPPLWALRQHPPIHDLFATLYGTDDLWVSFDRVSFKPPTDDPDNQSMLAEPIHWDGTPSADSRDSIQGLVYLRDTAEDQGAFCCVPSRYKALRALLAEQPQATQTLQPKGISDAELLTLAGSQGTVVLWHRNMPHSSTINRRAIPRWVQYVAMEPAGSERSRDKRIAMFEARKPPRWAVVQAVEGQQIPEPNEEVKLTAHGRRLIGYRD
jgi:hypothetical protein